MAESALTIGALAKRAGVAVDTARYYERRGVLPRAERRSSGYRAFRPEAVDRIVFVKELQAIGFSLDEIVDVLQLADRGAASCASVRGYAQGTLERVEAKINALTAMLDRLASALSGCALGACVQIEEASPLVRLPIAK